VRVRVYDGQARVGADSAAVTLHKGREVALAAASPNGVVTASFDAKDIDGFYRWSARRTEYVSEANVASAHVANDPRSSGYVEGVNSPTGAWSWNPYFGMFTYMPGGSGMYTSPFGYSYYSPAMLQSVYVPSAAPMGLRSGFPGAASPVSTAAPISTGAPAGLSRSAAGAPGGGLRGGSMPRH
jgi:hypothetical protein